MIFLRKGLDLAKFIMKQNKVFVSLYWEKQQSSTCPVETNCYETSIYSKYKYSHTQKKNKRFLAQYLLSQSYFTAFRNNTSEFLMRPHLLHLFNGKNQAKKGFSLEDLFLLLFSLQAK